MDFYYEIGKKIKSWAKTIFVVTSIPSVLIGFSALFSGAEAESPVMIVLGLILLLLGPFLALVSTYLLYAFGELVDKVCDIESYMSENRIEQKAKHKEQKPKITEDLPEL